MKLGFNLFGVDVTIIDTTMPIQSDEELQETVQEWHQAKSTGDYKTKYQASERLIDQGYRCSGKEWYLPDSEEE